MVNVFNVIILYIEIIWISDATLSFVCWSTLWMVLQESSALTCFFLFSILSFQFYRFFFLSAVYQLLPVFSVTSATFFQRRTGLANAGQGLGKNVKEREAIGTDLILILQARGIALQQKCLLLTKHTHWHTFVTGCVRAGPHLIERRANPVDIVNLHVR